MLQFNGCIGDGIVVGMDVDSQDSWSLSVGIQAGGEIHDSDIGVEVSWPQGSNEWTKTAVS